MKYTFILFSGLLSVLFSCSETSLVGDDFLGENSFGVSYIDTLSLSLSTFRFDSVINSSSERMVLGYQTDSVFTMVHTDGYFSLTLPSSYGLLDDHTYDSLTIYLPQDGYELNIDESISGRLKVEQLSQELESDSYYNFSTPSAINSATTILAEAEVKFFVDREENVEVRLDDVLGEWLFEQFQEETDIIASSSELQQYLKGFKISLELESTAAIGFVADSICFRLYSTEEQLTDTEEHIMDMYVSSAIHFNHYSYEMSEEISTIEEYGDRVSSLETGHYSVIHGGLGYGVVVELPTIKDLILLGKDYIVSGALLKIAPVESHEDLPKTIYATYVDEDLEAVSTSQISVSLNYDRDYGRNTYYAVDISDLIVHDLTDITTENYSILLTLAADLDNSMTSLWLGDEVYDSELILYTITNE